MKKHRYSDGSEGAVSHFVENNLSPFDETKLTDWNLQYHLSSQRENLLSWYKFNTKSSILEIGAGCGALTGFFCRNLKSVTANELEADRAIILKKRHKHYKNLEIVVDNIENFPENRKFDYVTSIGVLEYAGKYIIQPEPQLYMLRKINNLLYPGGTIIIAIENRFGLKYWSGCPEDHTGRLFDSLDDYPTDKIKTLGRQELMDLITRAGFSNIRFYYPVPDYKFPVEIFSDEYLPSYRHNLRSGIHPYSTGNQTREFLFNEKIVSDGIVNNNIFPFFANSFLVFASK